MSLCTLCVVHGQVKNNWIIETFLVQVFTFQAHMHGITTLLKCIPAHSLTSCLLVCAGEMGVVQSRSEAAMSERDPLSQPVHCE